MPKLIINTLISKFFKIKDFYKSCDFTDKMYFTQYNYYIMMKFEIDHENYLIIHQGYGRIVELRLQGRIVIKANQPFDCTGSGCFLMFPWISKVPENPYFPQLKDQYHGFYINSPRKITIAQQNADKIVVILKPSKVIEGHHSFIQTFTLAKGHLDIFFKVQQDKNDSLPYCFGYHPYLQLNGQPLQQYKIISDIKNILKFDEKTLPIYPFEKQQTSLVPNSKYNNLFEGGKYFQLVSKHGYHTKIQSNLPFWQIYTPPDGDRIAVQPVSFCGNLYNIYAKDPTIKLEKEGRIVFSVLKE